MNTQGQWFRLLESENSGRLLLDKLSNTVVMAGSIRQLTRKYHGPLFRAVRTDNHALTHDCYPKAGGDLDVADFTAFAAGNPCIVRLWNDQTQNALNLTLHPGGAGTIGPQPVIDASGVKENNFRPRMIFDGLTTWLDASNAFSPSLTQAGQIRVVMVIRCTTSPLPPSPTRSVFDSVNADPLRIAGNIRSTNHYSYYGGTSVDSTSFATNDFIIVEYVFFGGGSASIRVNGRSLIFNGTGALGGNSFSQFRLGMSNTNANFFAGDICEWMVITGNQTTADHITMIQDMAQYYGIAGMPKQATNITLVTDAGNDHWYTETDILTLPDGKQVQVYMDYPQTASGGGAAIPVGTTLNLLFSDSGGAHWTPKNMYLDGSAVTCADPGSPPFLPSYYTALQGCGDVCLASMPDDPQNHLVMFCWHCDAFSIFISTNGTTMWHSYDGGKTWGVPTDFTIVGLPVGLTQNLTFLTEQFRTINGVVYGMGRSFDPTAFVNTRSAMVFCKSTDNGLTWEYVSSVVGFLDLAGRGAAEAGWVWLGGSTLACFMRPGDINGTSSRSFVSISTDLGVTWGAATEITNYILGVLRPKAYTVNELKRLPNYQTDGRIMLSSGIGVSEGGQRRPALHLLYWDGSTLHYNHPLFLNVDGQGTSGCYGGVTYNHFTGEWNLISAYCPPAPASFTFNIMQYTAPIVGS